MANSTASYVLLIKWASGAVEQLEIPAEPWPGRSCPLLEVGPRDQEPCATVPVYTSTGPTLAEVLVHGLELPSMIVCAAPPGPVNPRGERLSREPQSPELTVRASLAAPSTCLPGYPGACDVQIVVTDGAWVATGECTMVPDKSDRDWRGGYRPYGTEPGLWVDGHLLARLRDRFGDELHQVLSAVAASAAECCARAAKEGSDGEHQTPEPKTEVDLAPVCARCDSDRPGPCEDCPELATLVTDAARRVPEWLAEAMSELASRHDLRSTEGNEQAMAAAVRMLDDYELRRQACASLARGYRACASALAATADGDETASASHHEAAGRHFREALELARRAEDLAA